MNREPIAEALEFAIEQAHLSHQGGLRPGTCECGNTEGVGYFMHLNRQITRAVLEVLEQAE